MQATTARIVLTPRSATASTIIPSASFGARFNPTSIWSTWFAKSARGAIRTSRAMLGWIFWGYFRRRIYQPHPPAGESGRALRHKSRGNLRLGCAGAGAESPIPSHSGFGGRRGTHQNVRAPCRQAARSAHPALVPSPWRREMDPRTVRAEGRRDPHRAAPQTDWRSHFWASQMSTIALPQSVR